MTRLSDSDAGAAQDRPLTSKAAGGHMASGEPAVVTVGIDIGTTSVKAVAVDGAGTVVARARVPHPVITPAPNILEHDARLAWHDGVLAAAITVADEATEAGYRVAAVNTAAMVPSL